MKLMPASSARPMMANDSGLSVGPPKFIAPRQSGDTIAPVRPSDRYSIGISLPRRDAAVDNQLASRHVARLVGCEIYDPVRDVLGDGQNSERREVKAVLARFRLGVEVLGHP